jgi:hypothetical protein
VSGADAAAADAARIFEAAFSADPLANRHAYQAALGARGLGGLPSFPRPAFFGVAERARIAAATRALHAGVEAVVRAYFAGADLGGAIGLDGLPLDLARASFRAAAAAGGGGRPLLGVTRYDLVYEPTTGRIAFLEVNAGDPSGMGYADALIEAALALPALAAVRERLAIAVEPLAPSHRRVLLDGYRAFERARGREPAVRPRVAFAVAADSTVLADHHALARLHREAGLDASVHDPRAFRWAPGGRLTAEVEVVVGADAVVEAELDTEVRPERQVEVGAGGGSGGGSRIRPERGASAPVDIVFRDTIDEWVLAPYWPATTAIVEAARADAAFVMNPLTSVAADWKGSFAALSDPVCEAALGAHLGGAPEPAAWMSAWTGTSMPDRLASLRPCLPWTRVASHGPTTGFDGERVDLAAFARAARPDLVLKPNAGWGGFGVRIGRETDPAAWAAALDAALARPGSAVLQRFAGYVTDRYPVFEGDRFVGFRPKRINTSVWVHGGEVVGLFARASDAPVINVHQGGGLLPVVLVGEARSHRAPSGPSAVARAGASPNLPPLA